MLKATITSDGRLKFPNSMLKTMGITKSTKVYIDNNGTNIIITPVDRICALCHSTNNMIEGFPICKSCARKVAEVNQLI